MSLEHQLRRSLISIATVAGLIGFVAAQGETAVSEADASLMAACEVPAVDSPGGTPDDTGAAVSRASWRTLLPSVFVRTRNQ